MLISVILISYNTAQLSVEALNSLFASVGDFELDVFVVDNASKDDSLSVIKNAFPNINLIANKINVGFGRANNQVLPLIKGDYVLLLNTDAFVQPDTLAKTVTYMQEHANCGVLGVRLVGRDNEQQPSCRYFPTPFNLFAQRMGLHRFLPNLKMVDDINWNPAITQNCDWVPGCYYLVRKAVIDQVGLFDAKYFLYSEEVDHCFAVKKAGWQVTYFAQTSVIHLGGESAKSDGTISNGGKQLSVLQAESELIYFRKNHGLLTAMLSVAMIMFGDLLQFIKDAIRLRLNNKTEFFNGTKLALMSAYKTKFGKVAIR